MTLGLILIGIGFGLAYITSNVIPLIVYICCMFDKDVRKDKTLDDWLFEPINFMIILMPIFGSIIGCFFTDEKWLWRLRIISIYIIVIGMVIAMIQMT